MRRIDHGARFHKDAHVRDLAHAVAPVAPKQHVAGLGLRAGKMFPHGGMVLLLRRPGNGAVSGFARCVLREAGAVEADEVVAGEGSVGRGAGAAAAAVDVGDVLGDPGFGGGD